MAQGPERRSRSAQKKTRAERGAGENMRVIGNTQFNSIIDCPACITSQGGLFIMGDASLKLKGINN